MSYKKVVYLHTYPEFIEIYYKYLVEEKYPIDFLNMTNLSSIFDYFLALMKERDKYTSNDMARMATQIILTATPISATAIKAQCREVMNIDIISTPDTIYYYTWDGKEREVEEFHDELWNPGNMYGCVIKDIS